MLKMEKRNNLKVKALAQYKAVRDADVLQYELIDKRLTTKPSMKGLALSCSSIEDYERYRADQMFAEDLVQVDCESLGED